MWTRKQLEEREKKVLMPWAQASLDSQGRVQREKAHHLRTAYQRDRARVIHSKAFRRLEGKTQVFLNGTGDHLRTRLTHTIEVASVSRTIARSLGLNEDLAEAIALAHDLGHSPFGHAGEETLHLLMKDHGGFEHNLQSLRVVEIIEQRSPRHAGLNLSHEVIEGLNKHALTHPPTLEAQIANLADEITYYSHDIDDGVEAGLLTVRQLSTLDAWKGAADMTRKPFPQLRGEVAVRAIVRNLIDLQVEDVITSSAVAIRAAGVKSVDDVRNAQQRLICYSPKRREENKQMRAFLYEKLYFHDAVAGVNRRMCKMLGEVFDAYLNKPALLGDGAARRVRKEGLHRTVCDYVAGMTDRFLIKEHERLCGLTAVKKQLHKQTHKPGLARIRE